MTAPLLEVRNLTVSFRTGIGRWATLTEAVVDASLTLKAGETLALVGESGCGKSTLVRTIFGLNPVAAGDVLLDGRSIAAPARSERRALSTRMQMVFQDPYSSVDPRLTVHEIVAEPLRIARRYDRSVVDDLLIKVGLTSAQGARKPDSLSGGQRQRVAIARALVMRPDLLVLDEPVSALDVSVQAQVLNLLVDIQSEFGLAYLFVSHDLSVVRHISDRVVVMQSGSFVEEGPTQQVFDAPRHPYTRTLLDAAPVADPRIRL